MVAGSGDRNCVGVELRVRDEDEGEDVESDGDPD